MSIIRANRWQRTDGSVVGTVLQVVSTLYSTPSSQSLSAGVDANITGLTATITPYTTSNKILIFVRWFGEYIGTAAHDHVYFISRNGTKINVQTTNLSTRASGLATLGTNYQTSGDWNNDTTPETLSTMTLDSPGSTSSLTYTFACRYNNAGTLYTNRSVEDADLNSRERGTSEIILMEIAA